MKRADGGSTTAVGCQWLQHARGATIDSVTHAAAAERLRHATVASSAATIHDVATHDVATHDVHDQPPTTSPPSQRRCANARGALAHERAEDQERQRTLLKTARCLGWHLGSRLTSALARTAGLKP